MMRLGRELLQQSGNVAGMVGREEVERSVGSKGIITEREVIDAVIELGKGWTRKDLAQSLGLRDGPATIKWLNKMVKRSYPIVGQETDGTFYYIEAPDNGARRYRHKTPESEAVSTDIQRGEQVRLGTAVSRLKGKESSRPKQRRAAMRRDAAYDRQKKK
jgi:hypothetical protein